MQTLIDVHCSKGSSLREGIAKDSKLEEYSLFLVKEQKPGRSPGWLKLRSVAQGRSGAINVQWDSVGVLRCRVVNRGPGRPDQIVGDFVAYLLARHRKRLRAINVMPRMRD
jgi:hypothetical protein